MSGEKKVVHRSDGPITMQMLKNDLRSLGIETGDVLLVHVALSKLGWVCGGAQAVLSALFDVLGSNGTLVMPAFSNAWSEPSYWNHPAVPESWWQTIRDEYPPFDPHLTPTSGLGQTPELFRTQPGVVRGYHPLVSFAAKGPLAQEIVKAPLAFPFGDSGVLGNLYKLSTKVLLLGAGYSSCTALHLAERRTINDVTRKVIEQGAAIIDEGKRTWTTYKVIETEHDDFEQAGDHFEATCPLDWTADSVGMGLGRLIDMRALVDCSTIWFEAERGQ